MPAWVLDGNSASTLHLYLKWRQSNVQTCVCVWGSIKFNHGEVIQKLKVLLNVILSCTFYALKTVNYVHCSYTEFTLVYVIPTCYLKRHCFRYTCPVTCSTMSHASTCFTQYTQSYCTILFSSSLSLPLYSTQHLPYYDATLRYIIMWLAPDFSSNPASVLFCHAEERTICTAHACIYDDLLNHFLLARLLSWDGDLEASTLQLDSRTSLTKQPCVRRGKHFNYSQTKSTAPPFETM